MRVLAARFSDREAAARVLEQLQARFGVGLDLETAPLGAADDAPDLTLLAGRFDDDARLVEVRQSIVDWGGTIVADVDEGWTVPRHRLESDDAGEVGDAVEGDEAGRRVVTDKDTAMGQRGK